MSKRTSYVIKGNFKRFWPEKSKRKSSLPAGWFTLNYNLVPKKLDRRHLRGSWFKIKEDNNKNVIYRILRFDPTLPGKNDKDEQMIVIDWDGWLYLTLNEDEENVPKKAELTISKANFFEVLFKASMKHPDPVYRLTFIIAVTSVLLGILSVILAIVGFICF